MALPTKSISTNAFNKIKMFYRHGSFANHAIFSQRFYARGSRYLIPSNEESDDLGIILANRKMERLTDFFFVLSNQK